MEFRVYAPQNWQISGYPWPGFIDSHRNFGFDFPPTVPHWISSPWSTANPLTLLVVSDCSSGNSSIALAKAAMVAGRGGSYPQRFTLSISLHLWLISRCCRRPLGFGFFNFLQKLMWPARVPIFWALNADGVRNLNCCNPLTLLILEMGLNT